MKYWYYVEDGKQIGPVFEQELVRLLTSDKPHEHEKLSLTTLVWTQELKEWTRACDVKNLLPSHVSPPPIPDTPPIQLKLTVMVSKGFVRKADGGKYFRFTGVLDEKSSGQILLEGPAAETVHEVMIPTASGEGAYLSLVFDEGYMTDKRPESFTAEDGTIVTALFADRPVYNIRCVKDGSHWTIGEAVVRPTPKSALTPDQIADAVSKALAGLRKLEKTTTVATQTNCGKCKP